ncbi:MAG TPA: 2-amino-4-hydroxy-6-hydroxymethyldihydropteridine diphosphokinase [Ktedonobacterales bacterium]|jgi:2-amino-4-hydroxy-6-hydroxymethyldihydropteridine diphosphokinase
MAGTPPTIAPPTTRTAYLGLGSNLGDRAATLRAAVDALAAHLRILAVSSLYDTAPQLVTDQPRFLNAALAGTTELEPLALLHAVKAIETALGRVPGPRFGPRALDIDLLLLDGIVLDTPELTLPHPRLAERAFALLPLAEIAARIAPALILPPSGILIADLARAATAGSAADELRLIGPLV